MWRLWRTLKELRESCLYGSMSFACFGAFWITLTFHLEAPPFQYSSAVIGLFGVLGVAGAVAATLAGRLADRRGPRLAIGSGLVVLTALLCGDGNLGPAAGGAYHRRPAARYRCAGGVISPIRPGSTA